MGWLEKGPESKAEVCPSCKRTIEEYPDNFSVCSRCGHLFSADLCCSCGGD